MDRFGKENMNQQPNRITSPDHPITKKRWQDEMADIGQMCTSMLSMTTFIKEHIPQIKSPNDQNPTNQNARKKFQPQGSLPHVAGLAIAKKK